MIDFIFESWEGDMIRAAADLYLLFGKWIHARKDERVLARRGSRQAAEINLSYFHETRHAGQSEISVVLAGPYAFQKTIDAVE